MRPVGPPFGAVLRPVGPPLGLYVGNLQVITGPMGCMLATYRSLQVLWGLLDRLWGCVEVCWTAFGAVCWQPTGHYRSYGAGWTAFGAVLRPVGPLWGCMLATYRSLQVLWGRLDRLWGCVPATYRSLQVLWGLLDCFWGCMLATYRLYDAFWTAFGSHQFQGCALFSRVKSLSVYAGSGCQGFVQRVHKP